MNNQVYGRASIILEVAHATTKNDKHYKVHKVVLLRECGLTQEEAKGFFKKWINANKDNYVFHNGYNQGNVLFMFEPEVSVSSWAELVE